MTKKITIFSKLTFALDYFNAIYLHTQPEDTAMKLNYSIKLLFKT